MKRLITPSFVMLLLSFVLLTGSVSGQVTIYTEEFNYPTGAGLPPGWVLQAEQTPPWSVSNTAIAGGESPELYLGYSFAAGTSRLISTPVNIEGYHELAFKYKQYLINYEADYGEVIGLDITFDGGENWQSLWEAPLGLLNISQDEFACYFNSPENATEMQFAFRYEGNSNAINAWAIDNITIESVVDNDLLIDNFSAMPNPKAGEETAFFVQVMNGGRLTQTGYTVRLMKDDVEVASVPGDPAAFTEKKFHLLWWTPGEENIGANNFHVVVDFAQDEIPANNASNNVVVNVLSENVENVQIGTGSWPLLNDVPYNFFSLYSLTQTLYFPEEIGVTNTRITGIQYTCQFDENIQNVPVQIYMGETDNNDLSEGWVNPSTLTLVFDSVLNFAKGYNLSYIPLDYPYNYNGGNLVVYSNKSYSEQVLWTPFISTLNTSLIRSRIAKGNDAPFDPMNPSTNGDNSYYYPNITLFHSTDDTSVDNTKKPASMILFPNPANDILHVQTDETILEIKMINFLGQVVYRRTVGDKQHEINVGNLNSGFYLVSALTPKGLTTQKVQVSE